MKVFVVGVIFGIVLSTVGFSGVAKLFDNGLHKVQETAREASK